MIEYLRWSRKWADKLDFLERVEREDGKTPPALRDRPELADHLVYIWNAFQIVSTDRPSGMGLAPIPFSAIDRFARRYAIACVDEFERLRRLIGEMDRALLDDLAAEQERDRAARKGRR
ncbi:phage tail assembly chaperone [Aureimonas ureilytica]|uniref:phage tail assembly chaperone n=1 Tax=Aureimonas ureilytica TaxID=401562 RepID=UPI003D2EA714